MSQNQKILGAIELQSIPEYEFELIEMEVSVSHVHIMLSFQPKRSIGEVIGIIKSISARALFRASPSLKHSL